MTTHAHYAGEFGAQKMTKKLEKDPAYRAARAEHYANEAKSASLQHAMSLQLNKKADAAEHALVAAHAEKRTKAHAAAAQKLAPDSEHATNAAAAHESARDSNAEIRARESGPKVKLSYVPGETAKALLEPIKDAVAATKAAFALTKKASDNPTVKTQMAASKAHEYAAKMSVGHDKNVALHTRMADHHRNRAETIPLDGTKATLIKSMDDHAAGVNRLSNVLTSSGKINKHEEAVMQMRRDPDAGLIADKGVRTAVTKDNVIKLPMTDGNCHWNSGTLFREGKIDAIVIGYAKNGDGWHQHTWGEKNGKIVETTASNFHNTEYHGVTLSHEESTAFSKWTAANPPGQGMVRTEKQEKIKRD